MLNLARVWFSPAVQPGGTCHGPGWGLPGFVDRRGAWRSTWGSTALQLLAACVGVEYLLHRPPVFPDEPYEVRWLLSYCDTSKHRGVLYWSAGFHRHSVNERGIETWRRTLPPLTAGEHAAIVRASELDPRARRFRAARAAARAQLPLNLEVTA